MLGRVRLVLDCGSSGGIARGSRQRWGRAGGVEWSWIFALELARGAQVAGGTTRGGLGADAGNGVFDTAAAGIL